MRFDNEECMDAWIIMHNSYVISPTMLYSNLPVMLLLVVEQGGHLEILFDPFYFSLMLEDT